MYIKPALVTAFLSVFVASCSTTAFSTKGFLVVPRVVVPPSNVHPEVAPYVPEFVDALQAAGFTVGPSSDPDALSLKVEFNPNLFNIRVAASLEQHGVAVLSVSATNPGWGTAIARGVAVNGRAEAALEDFRAELAKLMPRVKFKPDAPFNKSSQPTSSSSIRSSPAAVELHRWVSGRAQ